MAKAKFLRTEAQITKHKTAHANIFCQKNTKLNKCKIVSVTEDSTCT
jgi:hypothetical protein